VDSVKLLEARDIRMSYGTREILRGITFDVERGEVLVLMGGSGTGKSTLVRVLFGALQPTSGEVLLEGDDLTRLSGDEALPIRRKFGVLFQDGALLSSLSVAENVALPIRFHTDLPPSTVDIMVRLKLDLVGLSGEGDKLPGALSGGMRKRASLARAIALDPLVVFCDEPSSGLDPVATAMIDRLIRDLKEKMGIASVVVTHDVQSAMRIADRICLLDSGKVLATGTPEEIRRSEDARVQQFLSGSLEGPLAGARRKSFLDELADLENEGSPG
jgi:phospholipid/cholesterol/gamma-HCH transport system ATP-binding protein